ncbi:MAG: hypothetical protein QOD04_5636, partial [Pseudonocardiales bacterium]|nr:hypothetical protein [Pseudonocardiales bacterium]
SPGTGGWIPITTGSLDDEVSPPACAHATPSLTRTANALIRAVVISLAATRRTPETLAGWRADEIRDSP